MKHWHTKFDTYDNANLHLVLSQDVYETAKQFKHIRDQVKEGSYSGIAVHSWPDFYIFLDPTELNKRTIAHEIYHTTSDLMGHVGIKYQRGNDEAFAFINDWITGWVYFRLGARRIPSGYRKTIVTAHS